MIDQNPHDKPTVARRRDVVVATACGVLVAAMVGAAYAAVPLYNWFCRTTGFAGTTQVAAQAPDHVLERKIKVRFDANVGGGLPWKFVPEQNTVDVKIGQATTIFYKVTNQSARTTVAQASYNVAPPTIGGYFVKINCFCFTEQTMAPGETREMPVVFYVDPSLAQDAEQDDLDTITLSYTFFPLRQADRPVAASSTIKPQG